MKTFFWTVSLSLLALALPLQAGGGHEHAHDHDPAEAHEERQREYCRVCVVREGEGEKEHVAATAEHEGTTYYFCSEMCKELFLEWPDAYIAPTLPRPAPALPQSSLNADLALPGDLEGKVVLVDFWATWCPPCLEAMPQLQELRDELAPRGFEVLGISIDEGSKAEKKVLKALRKRGATYPVALDSTEDPAWARYNVAAVPMMFLIDAQGQIVAQWSGTIPHEEVAQAARKALGSSR